MARRILTALVLIPIVVALVWWGPAWLLAILATVVAILALIEFFELGDRVGLRPFRQWALFGAALIFYSQFSSGLLQTRSVSSELLAVIRTATVPVLPFEAALGVFVFGAVAIGIATRRPLADVLPALSVSSAGLLFIALPFSYIVRIDEMERVGKQLVLFTLVMVWAGDMLAYFVGQLVGRMPMAPALSPKKTWEGAFANVAASLVVAAFFARWMEIDLVAMLVIAALANLAGQAGDLIESASKRGASVKASGGLLPGHAGMLDRIDSLILAAPVVWAAYQWLGKQ
jgi:phosphatidate cytidylyltransferase